MVNEHRIRRKCLHPLAGSGSCVGKIINSHTVSKSSSLRRIARDGHVYHFPPNINALFDNNGRLERRPVGISQASTFPGFCQHHDKEMFAPIEDHDFVSSNINCFLLGFRALTREIYAKESVRKLIPKARQLDRGKPEYQQVYIQTLLDDFETGTELGLRDLMHYKDAYDAVFKAGDYSSSRYLVIRFSEVPHLLFSGVFYPEYDFSGVHILDIGIREIILDSLAVNAVALPTGGALVLHWLGDSSVCKQFVSSLLAIPDNQKANAVTQFAFETLENLFIAPDWWDQLGPLTRSLEARIPCGGPTQPHTGKCLIPDGTHYCEWKNPVIETNLSI